MDVSLTTYRSGSPPNDQSWFAITPFNHGPFEYRSPPVGPADHVPVPSEAGLALGNWTVAPAPQIHLSSRARVRISESGRSPSPNCSSGEGVYVTEIEGTASKLQSDVS